MSLGVAMAGTVASYLLVAPVLYAVAVAGDRR